MTLSGALERQILEDIISHEGCILWPYCDVKGLVTIGVGHLLPNDRAILSLPLYHSQTMRPANLQEKQAAWHEVKGAFTKGKGALAYKSCCDLVITRDVALELCTQRLQDEFLPALEKVFPAIDEWPEDAIRAVVDIAYNCGAHCFDHGWPNFVAACRAQNWESAAEHCTRADARRPPTDKDPEGLGPRNLWTLARLRDAAQEAQC